MMKFWLSQENQIVWELIVVTLDRRQSCLFVGLVENSCIYKLYRQTWSDLLLPPFQNIIRCPLVFYVDVFAVTSSTYANVFDLKRHFNQGRIRDFPKGGGVILSGHKKRQILHQLRKERVVMIMIIIAKYCLWETRLTCGIKWTFFHRHWK